MENKRIVELLNLAINILFANDGDLIERGANERCISHKLAMYLQPLFNGYNVDCEYNLNVDSPNERKRIGVLKTELTEIGKELTKTEKANTENPLTFRNAIPDIIIHKRGINGENLCIFEIKTKTPNTQDGRVAVLFDSVKLKAYTYTEYGSELKYQLGIYIDFETHTQNLPYSLKYYKEGTEIDFIHL